MAKDQATIIYPRPNKKVPQSFAVVGTASGPNIQSVVGTLLPQQGQALPPETSKIFISKRAPNGDKYRWLILFKAIPIGKYKLSVVGWDGPNGTGAAIANSGDSVKEVEVSARVAPLILYPEPNQDISGEAEYFVSYGILAGQAPPPILFATVGSQSADYIYNDVDFFCAQFPPLTDTGPQTLRVINSNDESKAIVVLL